MERVNTIRRLCIALLTTLLDVGGSGPEGPMYAAVMGVYDYETFTTATRVMVESKLCSRRGNVLTLTARGRQVAEECNALLAEAKGV